MERTRVWRGRVKSESRAEHERFVEWLNTAEAKEQYRKFLLTGYSLAQQGDDLTVLLSSEEPPAVIRFLRNPRMWPVYWEYITADTDVPELPPTQCASSGERPRPADGRQGERFVELGLRGKVAIVTGASRGIGRSIALGLAAEGCKLAICARGAERLEQTAGEARASGVDVLAQPVDATDGDALAEFVEAAGAHFGRIDILINNVGGGGKDAFVRRRPTRTGPARST